MSIRSMTGYGHGSASSGGVKVEVEVSTVNRKQFDVRINLSRSLAALEARAAKMIHAAVSRGCVAVTVRVISNAQASAGGVVINEELARTYVRTLSRLQKTLGIGVGISMDTVLRLPDVVVHVDAAADTEKVWRLLRRALAAALRDVVAMREREGATLERDLGKRLAKLRRRHGQIARLASDVPQRHRKCLLRRLNEAGLDLRVDDAHILREVAVFADRCDVSEELVRLESHFDQADSLMSRSEPAGRALDFMCQEMLREINTVGSKANDSRLSGHVIEFKAELERVREQVQNIE